MKASAGRPSWWAGGRHRARASQVSLRSFLRPRRAGGQPSAPPRLFPHPAWTTSPTLPTEEVRLVPAAAQGNGTQRPSPLTGCSSSSPPSQKCPQNWRSQARSAGCWPHSGIPAWHSRLPGLALGLTCLPPTHTPGEGEGSPPDPRVPRPSLPERSPAWETFLPHPRRLGAQAGTPTSAFWKPLLTAGDPHTHPEKPPALVRTHSHGRWKFPQMGPVASVLPAEASQEHGRASGCPQALRHCRPPAF